MDPERYLSFPAIPACDKLRHSVIMVKRQIPRVPQPVSTPLPTMHLSEEERGRIFSVYLRPWVLSDEHTSAHVPLLANIDILVSDVLRTLEVKYALQEKPATRKRLRTKQSSAAHTSDKALLQFPLVDSENKPFRRSYADAWKDYRCGHVVSKYAARIIQQFCAAHLADSLEAAEDEPGNPAQRERPLVDTS